MLDEIINYVQSLQQQVEVRQQCLAIFKVLIYYYYSRFKLDLFCTVHMLNTNGNEKGKYFYKII
jgi:hypothetical protein